MPYCFLLGIEFLRLNNLSVDVVIRGYQEIIWLQRNEVGVAGFLGFIKVERKDTEILNIESIADMQENCPMIKELRYFIRGQIPWREWKSYM